MANLTDTQKFMLLVGGGAFLYFFLGPLIRSVGKIKDELEEVGANIGSKLYDLTHADFVDENFIDGVIMPDGKRVNVVKSMLQRHVFPKAGKLYKVQKDAQGNLHAIIAPIGSRYDYPEFYVVQTATGPVSRMKINGA